MKTKVEDLVQKMVQTESTEGKTIDVAVIYSDFLEEFGLNPKIDEYAEGMANVEARLGSKNDRSIVISGHLDTVPFGNREAWTHDPLSGKIVDDYMWGRGTVDMKGGTGVLAGVMAEIVAQEDNLTFEIILAATAEEETGLTGAKHFTSQGIMKNAEHLLIAEPTGLEVAVMEKGVLWANVHAYGKQAHGSRPDLGHNAIEGLARLLPLLYEAIPDTSTPELGKTSLNYGLISGGTVGNVVAEHAVVSCDIRLTPGVVAQEVIQGLQRIVDKNTTAEIKYELEINENMHAPALLTTDRKFGEILVENTAKHSGTRPVIGGMYYATDAAAFMEDKAISFAIFGPGSSELLHQTNEKVSLQELDISRKVILDSILNLN